MRVDDFDFELPPERIALEPARPRDAARLLHVAGGVTDRAVRDLPEILRPGDMLVLNDTKVIPAQLTGIRPARAIGGGGDVTIDVTLHKRLEDRVAGAAWRAFLRPAKRVRAGDVISFGSLMSAKVLERDEAEATLLFDHSGGAFDAALAITGETPLPPYISRHRAAREEDADDYQTIYARAKGSVAAPTAGLHFTDDLFAALDARGVLRETITLHVGAGTFLPVAAADTVDHIMHSEWGEITQKQARRINAARAAGGRIIAVGTTTLRLLESAADDAGKINAFCAETDIFITPGHKIKAADALLTNFHLPRSTLFMLVCAFAGTKPMKDAYAHAISAGYRFYSFGDVCFLEPHFGE